MPLEDNLLCASHVIQVHAFVNEHKHIVDDIVFSQPLVRCNRASKVIDDFINLLLNICHDKYVKTSLRNMGCI